jgi:hypothetical protein
VDGVLLVPSPESVMETYQLNLAHFSVKSQFAEQCRRLSRAFNSG